MSSDRRDADLVGDLVGDVLACGFFEHVAGSICLVCVRIYFLVVTNGCGLRFSR